MALDEFEIDEVRFQLAPLDPYVGQAQWGVFAQLIQPLLGKLPEIQGLAGGKPDLQVIAKVSASLLDVLGPRLGDLEPLIRAFSSACQVWHDTGVKGAWVPLESRFKAVFARRGVLLIQWLAKCITLEYADFLAEFTALSSPEATDIQPPSS